MFRCTSRWMVGLFLSLALAGFAMQPLSFPGSGTFASETLTRPSELVLGEKLVRRLEAWHAERPPAAAGRIQVSVGPVEGMSRGASVGQFRYSNVRVLVDLDLVSGAVVAVSDSREAIGAEVWLVDNRSGPDRSVAPEPGDGFLRIGRLEPRRSRESESVDASLRRQMDPAALRGFETDLVAVVPRGGDLERGEALFGFPSLFDRLQARQLRRAERLQERSLLPGPPGLSRLPASQPPLATEMADLVAFGERLFHRETFEGNGRTCSTCHPAENDFTLDPAFISGLPDDDPLFIAEGDPALAELERPELMRRLGLILVNADGFEDPVGKFVMRSVPHLLGLNTTLGAAFVLDPENNPGVASDGTTVPPLQRTGWSGDGAPGNGTLLEFAVGAVVQHAPRTLNRVPGADFRLPTMEELEALEAFQLTLGRERDPVLFLTRFHDSLADRGRRIFQNAGIEPGLPQGKCVQCHTNAGARVTIFQPPVFGQFNRNSDIGTERMLGAPSRVLNPELPFDGGFGTDESCDIDGDGAPDPGVFGNCSFNTPSLVEAADTGPYFHNHSVATLEEAIAFYNSDAFNDTVNAQQIRGIDLESDAVAAIAAFLRAINAAENLRLALESTERAAATQDPAEARRRLELAAEDTKDVVRVLTTGQLHLEVVRFLEPAASALERGADGRLAVREAVERARSVLQAARSRILTEP